MSETGAKLAALDRLHAGIGGFLDSVALPVRLLADKLRLFLQGVGLHLQALAGVAAGLLGLVAKRVGLLIERSGLQLGLITDCLRLIAGIAADLVELLLLRRLLRAGCCGNTQDNKRNRTHGDLLLKLPTLF